MAHIPKYEKVKALILADIRAGIYRTGERIPTREQLIEKYSVTRTTIGQALKILVGAGVLATSKRGGTVVTGKRMPLNVALISTLEDTNASNILRVSERESESLSILNPLLEAASEFNLDFINIKNLSSEDFTWCSKYDCIIWVMPSDEFLNKLSGYKDKTLVINRYNKKLNFIATNHRQAVREMTEYNLREASKDSQVFYLESEGHENFIYRERREGFVDACQNANKFYRIIDLSVPDYTSMFDALMEIEFDKDKDVIMVSPSLAFTGAVLQMIRHRGLEFGENFFYSDFDNRHSLRNTGIKIVSAIQDYDVMGRELLEALRNFGEEKIQFFVPTEIVK
jgi:DNA-binding transcriptional regulator YhcF (GntR family)